MAPTRVRKGAPALDEQRLGELALAYVGRFATTRAKLRVYLERKVRQRGWNGSGAPDLVGIADRLAALGYIDEPGYALAKSRALTGRGYGKRRLIGELRAAGIAEDESGAARDHADGEAVAAALRFAERRRLGPFARERASDPAAREKALAAMIRAGHPFALARAVVGLAPGAEIDIGELAYCARLGAN